MKQAFDYMTDGLYRIINAIYGLIKPVLDIVAVAFKALLLMLLDMVFIVSDIVFGSFLWLINRNDWTLPDTVGLFNRLPPAATDILILIGFKEAVGLLVSIIMFKFFLRFIPFVRV